jgi:predicted dehydrogenase
MTPVRCALVGVGMMGLLHAAILDASPAAELAVACDPDPTAQGRLPPGTRLVPDLDAARHIVPLDDPAVFERYPGGLIAPPPG